jgi:phospholipid transport system substrate-binding protein
MDPLMPQARRRFLRFALLGLAAMCPAFLAQAQEAGGRTRDPQAEQFVQIGAQKIISVLADRNAGLAEKKATFRRDIDQLADVPRVTNFVLGKYARTITPAQRAQFAATFRAYAESVYQNRLDEYHGETLKVTGSVVRKPGDVVVNTIITGGRLSHPSVVAWRVLGAGSAWKVVDVQFKGVWLAITQQQDFVSTIDNAHGDIGVLIAQLERDAQRPPPHSS